MRRYTNERDWSWEDLRLFLAVAREGGLSGASRATGVSAPTLGRRMVRLERGIGAELFHRHASGYTLTSAGERVRRHAEEAELRLLPISEEGREESGREWLRVSVGHWFAHFLVGSFGRLQRAEDPFRISLRTSEKDADVVRRQAQIAIRNRKPTDDSLAVARLVNCRFAVYGRANCHDGFIGVALETPSARWLRDHHGGNIIAEVDAPYAALELCARGHGRVILPCFIGDRQPNLTRVGAPIADLDHTAWLVLNDGERHRPAPRVLIERLTRLIRSSRPLFEGAQS